MQRRKIPFWRGSRSLSNSPGSSKKLEVRLLPAGCTAAAPTTALERLRQAKRAKWPLDGGPGEGVLAIEGEGGRAGQPGDGKGERGVLGDCGGGCARPRVSYPAEEGGLLPVGVGLQEGEGGMGDSGGKAKYVP